MHNAHIWTYDELIDPTAIIISFSRLPNVPFHTSIRSDPRQECSLSVGHQLQRDQKTDLPRWKRIPKMLGLKLFTNAFPRISLLAPRFYQLCWITSYSCSAWRPLTKLFLGFRRQIWRQAYHPLFTALEDWCRTFRQYALWTATLEDRRRFVMKALLEWKSYRLFH